MATPEITRQHDETLMEEIIGETCENFIAVYDEYYLIFYIKLSGSYHRFYTDAGLLFWRSGESPDEDDDLYGGGRYVDLGEKYDLVGRSVERIAYANDHLEVKFSNGLGLLFVSGVDDVGARMIE
jgi:hypothetical protein